MVKSREDLVKWSLRKAEEYLQFARQNLDENRLFPAAEEIFRSVETTLEALLYHFGTRKIEYPGKVKKFTGRLALQFLIRDTLARRGRISREEYDRYLALASELHMAGYDHGRVFLERELERDLRFAEDLQTKAKSITKR